MFCIWGKANATLDAPAIFGGIYIVTAKKSISATATTGWLIRECSTKSTSTKSVEAEMETEEGGCTFVSKHIAQIHPSVPSCVKWSTLVSPQPLNYMEQFTQLVINTLINNANRV